MKYPQTLLQLIENLQKLPGVGRKSAERFAFKLMDWPADQIEQFSKALSSVQKELKKCNACGCLMDAKGCVFCFDPKRQKDQVCIVSTSKDVYAIEETHSYFGLYYVIESLFSPLDYHAAESIDTKRLIHFIKSHSAQEVIIALDATVEGDATSLYLSKVLKEEKVKVSRLAFGMPIGSSFDYVDGNTLSQALTGRLSIKS